MPGAQPFAIGQNAILQLFYKGNKYGDEMDVVSWDATENVTEVNDGVCGEDRDRLDTILNFIVVSLTMKVVLFDKIDAMIQHRADQDAQAPGDIALGMSLSPRAKGKGATYGFSECTLGAMKLSAGGRADRLQLTKTVRARYWNKIL